MMKHLRNLCELIVLFLFFGTFYFILESTWKGQLTNWRMFILSGIIGTGIGLINNIFSYETDLIAQSLIGAQWATLAEAILGYHWNVEMGLSLWNYSNPPLSYFSFCADQINLLFFILWVFLSTVAIFLADIIHYYLFKNMGNAPYYKIFRHVIFTMPERRINAHN